MRTSADQAYTTLFDIYEAAFDSANDNIEDTAQYVADYAVGALEISLSEEQAEKIAEVRKNWIASEEKSSNEFFYKVQKILESIEIA